MIKFFKKSHEKYNWVDHKNNFIGYEVHCETIKHAYIYNLKELDDLSDLSYSARRPLSLGRG